MSRNGQDVLEYPNRTRDNRDSWPMRQGGQGGSPAPAAAPQNTSSYSVILQDDDFVPYQQSKLYMYILNEPRFIYTCMYVCIYIYTGDLKFRLFYVRF